nr:hypothetical protein [Halococcus salsus]
MNYEATPDWDDPVRDLTEGGVDHVIEVGGQGKTATSISSACSRVSRARSIQRSFSGRRSNSKASPESAAERCSTGWFGPSRWPG